MTNLATLRAAADIADAAFDTACRPHYCNGRWGAYHAIECGQSVPQSVIVALDAAYSARLALNAARV